MAYAVVSWQRSFKLLRPQGMLMNTLPSTVLHFTSTRFKVKRLDTLSNLFLLVDLLSSK